MVLHLKTWFRAAPLDESSIFEGKERLYTGHLISLFSTNTYIYTSHRF